MRNCGDQTIQERASGIADDKPFTPFTAARNSAEAEFVAGRICRTHGRQCPHLAGLGAGAARAPGPRCGLAANRRAASRSVC